MNFSSSIRTAPIAFDPTAGAEAAALFTDHPAAVQELIAGAAGCAPYLAGLIAREAAWLRAALDTPPEAALDALLAAPEEAGPGELADHWRQAKRRVALLVALADLGGVWRLEEVTAALTRFADRAVDTLMAALIRAEAARGRLGGIPPDSDPRSTGLFALAMGKMGAFELNYSSDIDLIVMFDPRGASDAAFDERRLGFVRLTRRLGRLLGDVTPQGYIFRTDFRLRPDPSVTPVCLSTEAAERYYEAQGRGWERAAFIKARAAAGDVAAGEAFLDALTPFVWRRHLDFAAIEETHEMRLRIREARGTGGPLRLEGHNVKLGRGGIREIEFFAQTHQLIAGGRDPSLRVRGTCEALAALAAAGKIAGEVRDRLVADYAALRTVEHRLQMVHDAQTHTLPTNDEGFARLAAFLGRDSVAALRAELAERFDRVHALTETFFRPAGGEEAPREAFSEASRELMAGWSRLPALRSERARRIFTRIEPRLLSGLARAADPDAALAQFDRFLAGLPAGVQIFSLFQANPQLVDLLTEICAAAPELAAYLGANPGVFEAVLDGDFFEPLPDLAGLRARIAQAIGAAPDYEGQLDAARRVVKELRFRLGVQVLRGLAEVEEAAAGYARIAEALLGALWPVVVAEFSRRRGPMPGQGAIVVGLGSLGARRMGPTSDLDLMVLYDATGADPAASLSPSVWFARLTQALVTALTAHTAEGRLYEVDMRLRPSGRKGPVAVAWSGFAAYQREEAWTWEHLALTRARAICGEPALAQAFEAERRAILTEASTRPRVLADAGEMRARIAADHGHKALEEPWEAKAGPGRMLDIALAAQTAALCSASPDRTVPAQLDSARAKAWWTAAERAELRAAYARLQAVQLAGRLLLGGRFDPDAAGPAGRAFVLRLTGEETIEALAARLEAERQRCEALIDRVLPPIPAESPDAGRMRG